MSIDQQALHEYECYLDKRSDAKLAATIGHLIMVVGALYLFTGLANQCGNGRSYEKARIGILLVGISFVADLVALGNKISAKRNLKKSISIFNNGSQLGYQESIKLNFGTTSVGVGLTLSF